MIILGKYDEFGPEMGFPSLRTDFQPEPYEGQDKIVDYLKHGHIHMVTSGGYCKDIFTGESMNIQLYYMDDGVYSWTSKLAYYVEKYNLRLPRDFEEHVLGQQD